MNAATVRLRMRADRGSALVFALFVITFGTLIAVAVLELSTSAYARARRDNERQTLRNTIAAGLERARYELAATQDTTLTLNDTLGESEFWVTTYPVMDPFGAVEVAITAAYKGQYMTETRMIGAGFHISRPFDYAFASGQTDWENDYNVMGDSGTAGDVRINGDLRWFGGGYINSDLIVQGSIGFPVPSVTGSIQTGAEPLRFHSIDWEHYRANADIYVPWSVTAGDVSFPHDNAIIYVNGDLTLTGGTISGRGIVVVEGKLRFQSGPTTYGTYGPVAFLAEEVFVDEQVGSIVGYFYVPSGRFETRKEVVIFGNVGCRELVTGDDLTILLDTSLRDDPDLGWEMDLPGY